MLDTQELSRLTRYQIAANIRSHFTDAATIKLGKPTKELDVLNADPKLMIVKFPL